MKADNSIFDEPCTCEKCGHTGDKINTLGQTIFRTYNDSLLCASCRVDERLADDDFENRDNPDEVSR